MHYRTRALLNCVAGLSLLYTGNAAKNSVPAEALSSLTRTVNAVVAPSLAGEAQQNRPNRSLSSDNNVKQTQRRQIDTRPLQNDQKQTINTGADQNGGVGGPNNLNALQFQRPGNFPYDIERTYQYHYPPFGPQFGQNLYGGLNGFGNLPGNLPFDPRFFQVQNNQRPNLGNLGSNGSPNVQGESDKQVNADGNSNGNGNGNGNVKGSSNNNVDSVQSLEASDGDSKPNAQNRPFEGINNGFGSSLEGGPNPIDQAQNAGAGPTSNTRFSSVGYERIRQNFYSDPGYNDQRNYFNSFNDIPFSSGPPYRSPLNVRFGLDYNDNSGRAGVGTGLRTGNGAVNRVNEQYFNGFPLNPYRHGSGIINYNSIGNNPVVDDDGGTSNPFVSNFNRFRIGDGLQYPGNFNDDFYQGSRGQGIPGFGLREGDANLKSASLKNTARVNIAQINGRNTDR